MGMIVGSLSLDPYVKLRQGLYRFLLLENAVSLEPANAFFRLEMLQGEKSLYSLHPHPCGEGQTTPKTLLSFIPLPNENSILLTTESWEDTQTPDEKGELSTTQNHKRY